ncbi:hypothetical protein Rsub_02434 [Raphidocelis subcapitata]|uniref:B9 domain-containing protein 1 n=1 Tax=Raphidocelis subcapitata TaxID=307507 RepID=A0A2V0NRN0_9CHLO|nr:hypothetical protein Rsub_02434 [Raphidocelis subcapitata]|eukprot:GBF90328.1 hypothetical protein Rsub_02434 [Raphidocelis subcapitata]
MADAAPPSFFTVMATGQLESGDIPDCDTAYCKFEVVTGEDWQLLDGMETGITQVLNSAGPDRMLVWNFPLDVTYKSTNAFGWPQVVVSVYGVDAWGRDVVKGYGSMHLPTCPGRYELCVRLYRPRSASLLQTFLSWLTGMPAEFADPRFPAYGPGREVTRVVSSGSVNIQVNLLTKARTWTGHGDFWLF